MDTIISIDLLLEVDNFFVLLNFVYIFENYAPYYNG